MHRIDIQITEQRIVFLIRILPLLFSFDWHKTLTYIMVLPWVNIDFSFLKKIACSTRRSTWYNIPDEDYDYLGEYRNDVHYRMINKLELYSAVKTYLPVFGFLSSEIVGLASPSILLAQNQKEKQIYNFHRACKINSQII